ncbi:MAG TPA: hypothetical protein PKI81_10240 [bacterium]|nr:hypothetical protein [bacterium]HOZ20863.1 hypothetical protein [bacterium]
MRKAFLVLGIAAGVWTACEQEVTNPLPGIPVPRFVAAAADTSADERGIDAVPEEDAIFLQWHRDQELSGFQLFRRFEGEKNFGLIALLTARDSSFYDRVPTDIRCYYYLRGLDEEERLGAPSDTVDYMLLAKAFDLQVTAGEPPLFSWSTGLMRPAFYLIRLYEEASGAPVWIGRMAPGYQGTRESTPYNSDGRAVLPRLQSGVLYRWRIDCAGAAARTGSESAWQRFTLY